MVLPGTKKIVKLLGLHSNKSGGSFSGDFDGLGVSMREDFGKKTVTLKVPSITYDDRVWLEQFNNPYFVKRVNTHGNNTIEMEFPGFPMFFPTERLCHVVKSTLHYFMVQYGL